MKVKNMLSQDYDLYFEPINPITTAREFTDELINYCSKENKDLTIIEETMQPTIEIEGNKYICKLGEPFRACKLFKTPINPTAGRFLGYKWVYIYKS